MIFSTSKRHQHLLILLAVIMLGTGLSFCNQQDKASWRDEKPEPGRFIKVKLGGDFNEPMEMAVLGDGKIIVIERKGAIKLFSPATRALKQIATMPVYSGQEDGLLGVTLDPQFDGNHFIYFYYSPDDSLPRQRVSRFLFENDSVVFASEKVIIEIPRNGRNAATLQVRLPLVRMAICLLP
jgi:cytochrome c